MDIKTRIDELSEAEAKAALESIILRVTFRSCVGKDVTISDIDKIKTGILDEALKEVQHGHKGTD